MKGHDSGADLHNSTVQIKGFPGRGGKQKAKKQSNSIFTANNIIQALVFIVWLFVTGIFGYFIGYDPRIAECPEVKQLIQQQPVAKAACPQPKGAEHFDVNMPLTKEGGFTVDELRSMWQCSHAEGTDEELHKHIFPDDMKMDKTKWKSILTVEPKAFFKKYLTQYPADTRAVQPVVVFSHKPLNNFDEMSEVCKVIDIAIVPDKPGVCVAVTETYHDVASYHMLHADRQKDGTFALTGNSVPGRTLPKEPEYAAARALLLDFFKYGDKINQAVDEIPRYSKGRVVVASFVDDSDDMELFLNSVKSAAKAGISKNKFAVFTTNEQVVNDMKNTKIKVVYIPELKNVGTQGDANVGPKLRRYFIQAWLAFACANSLNKVLWQSPATYWVERPDNIVNAFPAVETVWAYKGRADRRAAPFFITFDFFVAVGQERAVHLLHELILHFDLVMAWDSLDAVASYRLSENNSRYGTTTYVMPPYKVLHTELVGHDPLKVKAALEVKEGEDKPFVIIVPKDYTNPAKAKQFMIDAGLWIM